MNLNPDHNSWLMVGFKELTQLVHLDLGGCDQLRALPEHVGGPNLKVRPY